MSLFDDCMLLFWYILGLVYAFLDMRCQITTFVILIPAMIPVSSSPNQTSTESSMATVTTCCQVDDQT